MFRWAWLALVIAAGSAQAAPLRFQQQGRLIDSTGAPIEGEHTLIVRLYDDATAATPALWTRTFTDVAFQQGYFAVTLTGSDDEGVDLSTVLTGAGERWLTTDAGSGELDPRQPIETVPFAAVAQGLALVDQSASCDTVGGIGFDSSTGSVVVCTGTSWQSVGSPGCPDGTAQIGQVCMDLLSASATDFQSANTQCIEREARLCTATELLYACPRRDTLGMDWSDNTWYWTDSRIRMDWNSNYYPTHQIVRRVGAKCFDNTTSAGPSDVTMSWEHGPSSRPYFCCRER